MIVGPRSVLSISDVELLRSVLAAPAAGLLDRVLDSSDRPMAGELEDLRDAIADAMLTTGMDEATGALNTLGERLDNVLDKLATWNYEPEDPRGSESTP